MISPAIGFICLIGTTIILVAALFSGRSRESGQAGRDGFDLYTLTVVLVRIQGVIYVVYFLFNIGYAYNYLNYIFGSDISSVPHVYVVESWMYLARETLQLVVAFVFLKYAKLVAALLVRGLRGSGVESRGAHADEGGSS